MFKRLISIFAAVFASVAVAQTPIQTQFGPDGVNVDLLHAKVSGKVLSVAVAYRLKKPHKNFTISPLLEEIHYIDDLESKKYQVLRDEKGDWLAGPQVKVKFSNPKAEKMAVKVEFGYEADSGSIGKAHPESRQVVWFKFPAPPEGTETIQINLPSVSPFMEVPIQRKAPKVAPATTPAQPATTPAQPEAKPQGSTTS